jgi:hypothetical protein
MRQPISLLFNPELCKILCIEIEIMTASYECNCMQVQLNCTVIKILQHSNLVDRRGHVSTGALQASGLQGADSYNLNSLSVTAAKTDCQRSGSSLLSELTRPFCNRINENH